MFKYLSALILTAPLLAPGFASAGTPTKSAIKSVVRKEFASIGALPPQFKGVTKLPRLVAKKAGKLDALAQEYRQSSGLLEVKGVKKRLYVIDSDYGDGTRRLVFDAKGNVMND